MIPGPIGMACTGASVVAYAAAGDKKAATIAAVSIAAAAVGAGVAVKAAQVAKEANSIVKLASAGEKSLGSASRVTSAVAGRMWTKRMIGNVSKDGLSRYRGPAIKKSGERVANFERRLSSKVPKRKAWSYPNRYTNGHLTIRGWL